MSRADERRPVGSTTRRPPRDGGPRTRTPHSGDDRNNALSSLLISGSMNHTGQHEAPRWEASAHISRSTTMHGHGTCPSAESAHCWTAHVVADHTEQG